MGYGYKGVGRHLRHYVTIRDGGICVYCQDEVGCEIEHVIPLAQNGPTIKGNLVLSCRRCNRLKRYWPNAQPMMEKGLAHLLRLGESLDWLEHRLRRVLPAEIDRVGLGRDDD